MKIRLKDIREEKKVSIRGLAKLSGVDKNHIINIESKKTNPSIYVIVKLAKALGVTLNELVDLE